jgi:peptide-methionine (S)-S-oxide reductase
MLKRFTRALAAAVLVIAAFAAFAAVAATEQRSSDGVATAVFAGGCFWCMEPPYDELEGVISTTSGYLGGHKDNPTYEEVSRGGTGHAEVVKISYDPDVISYQQLLEVFWRNIDPVSENRQFCDVGSQYRSAIFYLDQQQKTLAEESRRQLDESGRFDEPIVTGIEPAGTFYPAEKYHQDYYRKNPLRYRFYRFNCGRDQRLQELWGERPEG